MKKIGQLLVEDLRITEEQIDTALVFQRSLDSFREQKLGSILISLGWLDEDLLYRYLDQQSNTEKKSGGNIIMH